MPSAFISAIAWSFTWSSCLRRISSGIFQDRLDQRQQIERVVRAPPGRAAESSPAGTATASGPSRSHPADPRSPAASRRPASRGMISMILRSTRARKSCQPRSPMRLLRCLRLMAVADQPLHRAAAIAAPAEHVQQHPVRDLEARDEPLRRRGHQPRKGVLVPVHEVLLRRLALHELLAVRALSRQAAGSRSRAPAPAPRPSRDRRSPCGRRARRSGESRAR